MLQKNIHKCAMRYLLSTDSRAYKSRAERGVEVCLSDMLMSDINNKTNLKELLIKIPDNGLPVCKGLYMGIQLPTGRFNSTIFISSFLHFFTHKAQPISLFISFPTYFINPHAVTFSHS